MELTERLTLPARRAREIREWADHHGYGGAALINSDIEDNLALADRLEARRGFPRLWGVSGSTGADGFLCYEDQHWPAEIKSSRSGKFSFLHRNDLTTLRRLISNPIVFNYKWPVGDDVAREAWVVFPPSPVHTLLLREWVRVVRGRPHLKKKGDGLTKRQEQKIVIGITAVRACGTLLIDERV